MKKITTKTTTTHKLCMVRVMNRATALRWENINAFYISNHLLHEQLSTVLMDYSQEPGTNIKN